MDDLDKLENEGGNIFRTVHLESAVWPLVCV